MPPRNSAICKDSGIQKRAELRVELVFEMLNRPRRTTAIQQPKAIPAIPKMKGSLMFIMRASAVGSATKDRPQSSRGKSLGERMSKPMIGYAPSVDIVSIS